MTHRPTGKKADLISRRQQAVARLRLRGLTINEIVERLPELGILGQNEKPFGPSIITRDLVFLRAQWIKAAQDDIKAIQAEQYATILECQRRAWAENNVALVLQAHDRIAKLLGTNAPERQEIGGIPGGDPIQIEAVREKIRAMILARAASIATETQPRLIETEAHDAP